MFTLNLTPYHFMSTQHFDAGFHLITGYMAGGQYAQKGSGSNYLCLADKPHWNYYVTENENGGIRGVEYHFGYHSTSEIAKFFGSNIRNDDAPCAVCETNRAATVLVIIKLTKIRLRCGCVAVPVN